MFWPMEKSWSGMTPSLWGMSLKSRFTARTLLTRAWESFSLRITPSLGDPMNSHNREIARTGPTEIDGLSLESPANSSPQVIVSKQHTVKLESGIKIELRVTGQ